MNKVLTKVLVGSRLHGLDTPESDYDCREVFINPLRDVLSPFKSLPNNSTIDGKQDDTSFEFRHFCKYLTKGNPTILEVLFSDIILKDSEVFQILRKNVDKFFDTDAIYNAHKGYSAGQWSRILRNYDVLSKDDKLPVDKRAGKLLIASIRVAREGANLLCNGSYDNQIPEGSLKDLLMILKSDKITMEDFRKGMMIRDLEMMSLKSVYESSKKLKPDIDWIEDFIYNTYEI